jgi:serine/threonine protein kinase
MTLLKEERERPHLHTDVPTREKPHIHIDMPTQPQVVPKESPMEMDKLQPLIDTVLIEGRATTSALFYAVADGSAEQVQAMLRSRADPNSCDYEQRRPLHVAAGIGENLDIIKLLIDHNAKVNVIDRWGQTPLTQSQRGGHFKVEDMLKRNGAKLQKERLQKQSVMEKWEIKRSDVQIGKELSRTLKSIIHRATWNGTDVVAKFVIPPQDEDDIEVALETQTCEDFEDEILHEISLLSTIRHPDLVMFLGCCLQDSPVMFISQYMAGGDLENYYQSKRNANDGQLWKPHPKAVNKWSRSICRALNFLHSCARPIIHRDLKPLNILLTEDLEAKVTDFGISKDTLPYGLDSPKKPPKKNSSNDPSSPTKNSSYTMTGGVGSWRYMAPEVARHQKYTEKVDVYAFALILYFMSSGRQPFHEYADAVAILDDYTNGKEPRPKSTECHISFRPIMEASWRCTPAERPSAADIIELLVESGSTNTNCTCVSM